MYDRAVQFVILVAGPLAEVRRHWLDALEQAGKAAVDAEPAESAGSMHEPGAVLLTGLSGDPSEAEDWVLRSRRQWPGLPVVVLPRVSSEDAVIACFRAGASDYVKPPAACFEAVRCLHRLRSAAAIPAPAELTGPHLIGASESIARVRSFVAKIAPTNASVLITGETGTGKELIAEMIHSNSLRHDAPLVRINCAALPDHLLESELFGWNRGAFTGAHASNPGKVELAKGGTVLLDEIGDMSPSAQAKILRLIESREAQRLGGRAVTLDVRFLAATNQDIEQLANQGKFRKDLYFRLKVVRINLPRLKDRKEDIPVLLAHYVAQMNRIYGRAVEGFSEDARHAFLGYDWPGNVRELRNLVEAVYLTSTGSVLTRTDVSAYLSDVALAGPAAGPGERDRLIAALSSARWNKSRAARQLSWSRMTLYRKMRQYHISDLSNNYSVHAV